MRLDEVDRSLHLGKGRIGGFLSVAVGSFSLLAGAVGSPAWLIRRR